MKGRNFQSRTPKNIPNTISKIRTYFTRAQVRLSGGKVFMDTFVQHTVPMDEIRRDSEWFLEENQMAMYIKQLQVESTIQKRMVIVFNTSIRQ